MNQNSMRNVLAFVFFGCVAVIFLFGIVVYVGWERPPMQSTQLGFRGTGEQQVTNPRFLAEKVAANSNLPEVVPATDPTGTKASEVYENVQVLGDLDDAEFTRLMVAITNWVSPEQGCNYCHTEDGNYAAEGIYQKTVARRMLQMTQHLNDNWKVHVAASGAPGTGDGSGIGVGVTCYTCHRGKPVPANIWFVDPGHPQARGDVGYSAGQNFASPKTGFTSLPYDPFTPYLADAPKQIRVVSTTALPSGSPTGIKDAEHTYGLMMHLSGSLGVNCTYCHNSRSFASWQQSTPLRTTAWYGLRMVSELNRNYLEPLKPVFPPHRLGPLGDVAKVNCATCHQGVAKPLLGVNMVKDYQGLGAATPVAASQ